MILHDKGAEKVKKILTEENGMALPITILTLLMVSIFGLSLLGTATSNFRAAKVDSRVESSYYIAESGVHYMVDSIKSQVEEIYLQSSSSEEMFQQLDNLFTKNPFVLNSFEDNNGEQPKATITVSSVNKAKDENNYREYTIESIGSIGDSTRTVTSTISIKWPEQEEEDVEIIESLLFYSKSFSFHGTAINAASGSIVMDGIETHNLNGGSALNISNMYFNGPVIIDGGSASFGSVSQPGKIYVNGDLDFWNGTRNVYGDIRVNGDFRLKDARIYGDVYVDGDLELGWTPEIHKNIYYTGKLTAPNSYNKSLLRKCIKVESVDAFDIPMVDFDLKEDSWFRNNGYVVKGKETGTIPKDAKMLVDNYKNTNWQDIKGRVVIVSKGDIILRGGNGFTGALIAPNGKVEYSGDGTFNGIIISKNEISLPQGGNHFNFKSIEELFGDNLPAVVKNRSDEEPDRKGSGKPNGVEVTIESNVKEK